MSDLQAVMSYHVALKGLEYASMSWSGFNLFGDQASIREAGRALHVAGQYAYLTARLEAAEARIAELDETWTDENGTVWKSPTAWSYATTCLSLKNNYQRLEAAEADARRLDFLGAGICAVEGRLLCGLWNVGVYLSDGSVFHGKSVRGVIDSAIAAIADSSAQGKANE